MRECHDSKNNRQVDDRVVEDAAGDYTGTVRGSRHSGQITLAINRVVTPVITNLSDGTSDRGITARGAAWCASVLGGSSLLGRVGVGRMLDRFFGPRVALTVNVITAMGIYMLAHASTSATGSLAAILIGIGAGGEAALTPYLLTRYFGLRGFSTLYGLTWTFYAIAAAIGPVILGRAFDATGSYSSLLALLAAALALAAAMNLALPKYPLRMISSSVAK